MDAPTMSLMNGQSQPDNFDDLLKESIRNFLSEYPKNISRLCDLFFEVILDSEDPSFEVMWFYSALTFHECIPSILSPQEKLVFVNELLEFLNTCIGSNNMVKKVAVIAPVLYLLYHLHFNFSARDPSLREEIEIIVEKIVSRICCAQYFYEGDLMTDLGSYIFDLVRVWIVDPIRISNTVDDLASFFPTLGSEFQREVTVSMGYLVGVVLNEAFLLRLCLKISPGVDKEVLRRDMLNLAIQTIEDFQNFYFLDMLLNMLMEPSLPAALSLSSEDSVILRKVLYDAVILVDYSFYSESWAHSNFIVLSKKLSLIWVLAAGHAVQCAPRQGYNG